MRTPADVVIEVCGGPRAVADMCGIDLTWVYRWTYPVERGGTGGTVPSKHQARLLKEARARGLALKPAHFFPAPHE
jgi:hypothetical protein